MHKYKLYSNGGAAEVGEHKSVAVPPKQCLH